MLLESHYDEKEKKERKIKGYESEPIKYKQVHLTVQDDFQHSICFTEPRNHLKLKYPKTIYPD